MRTHVEFDSDAFPAYPGEEESINPGIWGKRLAEYLVAELSKHGFTGDAPDFEDWGVYIELQNAEFPLWIGCGNQGSENGDHFVVFIEPSKPEIRRGWLFKRRTINTVAKVSQLANALDAILLAHPGIRNLSWQTEDQ